MPVLGVWQGSAATPAPCDRRSDLLLIAVSREGEPVIQVSRPPSADALRFHTEAPDTLVPAFHNRDGILMAPIVGSKFGLWRVRLDGSTTDNELPLASLKPGRRPVTTVGGVLQAEAIEQAKRSGRSMATLVDRSDDRVTRPARSAVIDEAKRSVDTEKGRYRLVFDLDVTPDGPRYKRPTAKQPSVSSLMKQVTDEAYPRTTDGCRAYELDGQCEHGHVTWLTYLCF